MKLYERLSKRARAQRQCETRHAFMFIMRNINPGNCSKVHPWMGTLYVAIDALEAVSCCTK